ncbi:MAG: hypothetical protein VYC42_09975 [Pseudomonadota bacterium]|nr:hypothetical protein [Pseudomonadota bacterium]
MTPSPQLAAGITLSTLSISMRTLLSCFLITVGLGFLSAMVYLFLQDIDPHRRMGMSAVPAVAAKYYGARSNTRLESALRGAMSGRVSEAEREQLIAWIRSGASEDTFPTVKPILERACVACHNPQSGLPVPPLTTYAQVRKQAEIDTGYSLLQLARVSHVHLFGISILFLLTGAIFALSEISWKWRLAIVATPYLAMWADIGSWWITKYDPAFAVVVVTAGALIGLALAVQIFVALWEMWIAPRKGSPVP